MSLSSFFHRHLYLRIWLAVIGSMALLTLGVDWVWRIAQQQKNQSFAAPGQQMVLHDPAGHPVLRGLLTRTTLPSTESGNGAQFRIQSDTGESFTLRIAPTPPGNAQPADSRLGSAQPADPRPGGAAFWLRPPWGLLWLLTIASLAMAVGVYPIIRGLTLRLQALQRSVQQFGAGDLSVRIPEQGHDELADLARQLNAAAARAETLVKSHKSLLANASHELRSPLTRIRMGLELMGGRQPSPAFREEILHNIAELDQLVDEILLASRLDVREADVGTVELVDLIGLAAEECARVNADLAVNSSSDALQVHGVAKLLRRALRNLLENAQRHSADDITVVLERHQDHAEVQVCDRGPGVPPNQRERIFEPFYRLPGASESAGGVGLGLALARSIAGRHNGSVHCKDHPGGGACFVLRLPLVRK